MHQQGLNCHFFRRNENMKSVKICPNKVLFGQNNTIRQSKHVFDTEI